MTRWLVVATLLAWPGVTLLLSQTRWFSRVSLTDRLRPYTVGAAPATTTRSALSVESFRDAVGPLARVIGESAARLLGVGEDVSIRLARIHSPLDATAFRVRQLGAALAAFAVASLATLSLRPPTVVGVVVLTVGPLLAFLVIEQQLSTASRRWQRRLFLELPVVAEQLAMLMSAGYSLGAAVNRVARRGTGATARDLQRVSSRLRHGLSDAEALREWAATARVPAVDRLVAVLGLNRDTSDLGRLLTAEARVLRADVHRELTEVVERRSQQVWIPVTVATLVPGVIFLAIPFVSALRVFAT